MTVVSTYPVTVITTFLTPVVKSAIGSINDCFLFTHHPSCVVPVYKYSNHPFVFLCFLCFLCFFFPFVGSTFGFANSSYYENKES